VTSYKPFESALALAELHHKTMREELGIAGEDAPEIRDLFHQKYRGSRYSFGYPACPNLEDQTKLFVLLKPEENVSAAHFWLFIGAGTEYFGSGGASSRG
jgi:cobalamin-dependent methionine synthase I